MDVATLSERYRVTADFYRIDSWLFCRNIAICLSGCDDYLKPQLAVVMMNPGSAKPLDAPVDAAGKFRVLPDATQQQVMRVMDRCGINAVRVFNLSDLREPKSKVFFQTVKVLDNRGIAHSLFDDRRTDEFWANFPVGVPVVFAWGVNANLTPLAMRAAEKIAVPNPLGKAKPGEPYAYYHPLPRTAVQKEQWVELVVNQLKGRKDSYSE